MQAAAAETELRLRERERDLVMLSIDKQRMEQAFRQALDIAKNQEHHARAQLDGANGKQLSVRPALVVNILFCAQDR